MVSFPQVRLDDGLIESLEQDFNVDSAGFWSKRSTDTSPSFPLSPDSPISQFENGPDATDFYEEGLAAEAENDGPVGSWREPLTLPAYQKGGKKKRGRKPLRPFDPIKKKTEEKDKYWLRGFRAFMKANSAHVTTALSSEDRAFWRDYLSKNGRPEKGNVYLSYGKQYKNYLFSHSTFTQLFCDWFEKHAEKELTKKCEPNSDLWFVFYDYGVKELLTYAPDCVLKAADVRDSDIEMVGEADSLLCDTQ